MPPPIPLPIPWPDPASSERAVASAVEEVAVSVVSAAPDTSAELLAAPVSVPSSPLLDAKLPLFSELPAALACACTCASRSRSWRMLMSWHCSTVTLGSIWAICRYTL